MQEKTEVKKKRKKKDLCNEQYHDSTDKLVNE